MTLVIPQFAAAVVHSLRWTGDPEQMAVTYGVLFTTPDIPDDPSQIASDLADLFIAELTSALSTTIELVNTDVTYQFSGDPGDPPLVGSSGTTGAGDETGTLLPQNSAYLVHKRTNTGGRGGRGRLYIPGVFESEVDNLGNVSSGELAQWNGVLADWLAGFATLAPFPAEMVVLHDSEGAHAADPPRVVTLLTMDPVISTQRRRLRR